MDEAVDEAVVMDAVSRVYGKGAGAVAALRQVSVSLPKGGFTAVMGPSGKGLTNHTEGTTTHSKAPAAQSWTGAKG
ncbi:hypothetical protein AB0C74_26935 [Spirillospora sp. NPDC048832]